jgi:hypothetical protein
MLFYIKTIIYQVFAGDAWRDMMIIRTSSQSSRERKTIKSIFVREKRQDAGECSKSHRTIE